MTFTPQVPITLPPLRPKWLSLATVGVIVVAVFSIMTGLVTPISVGFLLYNPFANMPGMPPELGNLFALQQKALGGPALVGQVVVGLVGLATGLWATVSSVRLLSGKSEARLPFRRATLALALAESASVTLGVWLQNAMGEFMRAMAFPSGGVAHGVEEMMQTFVQAMVLVSIVAGVGWGVMKIAFLAWAHRYAGIPSVVAYFDRSA